ncbi:MAG: hypothetical protein K0R75_799 [Paenibacillaceae bacterium]|nr:hypothetical protein [Paenibacillaceae bacterium]
MEKDRKLSEQVHEQPMTYDEYAAMPDDEFAKYELVDGKMELLASAGTRHQALVSILIVLLTADCQEEYVILPDIDVIFENRNSRRPDLVMVHRDRLHILTKRGVEGLPDLVVEILSPSSVRRDKVSKVETYARFGVPEYWIVDMGNEALEQYILAGDQGKYTLHNIYESDEAVQSDKLTCVSFTMKELLARLPELPNE